MKLKILTKRLIFNKEEPILKAKEVDTYYKLNNDVESEAYSIDLLNEHGEFKILVYPDNIVSLITDVFDAVSESEKHIESQTYFDFEKIYSLSEDYLAVGMSEVRSKLKENDIIGSVYPIKYHKGYNSYTLGIKDGFDYIFEGFSISAEELVVLRNTIIDIGDKLKK